MAAFLTHLVVGERVWHELDGVQASGDDYGSFLFGCLAPDVDKLCTGLEQATTHFLPKDGAGTFVWRRSQHFLDHQRRFLRAPFRVLEAAERALVMGYLCHVATDEITGRLALSTIDHFAASGVPLPNVDAILSVMDPRFWAMASDPEGVAHALAAATIPEGTLPFVPPGYLPAMHQIVLPQVREGGGMIPFLNMVRRQRQWMRHGQIGDGIKDIVLEAELAAYSQEIEADMPAAARLVDGMALEQFVDDAVDHSCQRIHVLLDGRVIDDSQRL
jgi:hypothetical protein